MKSIWLLELALLFILASCQEEQTIIDQRRALLKDGKWQLTSVVESPSQKEYTESFTGIELAFQDETYTSVNGGELWGDGTNTWSFSDEKAKALTMANGNRFFISELTDSSLTLRFVWSQEKFSNSVIVIPDGIYVFSFQPVDE